MASPAIDLSAGLVPKSSDSSAIDLSAGLVSKSQEAPQGLLSQLGSTAADVGTGVVKGLGDTVSGVSHLINKIPGVGETLAPSAGIGAMDQLDTSKNTAQSVGKGIEGIAEFAAGDEALKGLAQATKLTSLAAKYPAVRATMDLATAHPWLAKIITEGTKGAIVGGGEGAVKGAQQGQAATGAAAGAAVGGALGGAKGTLEGAVAAVKNLQVNPFRAVLEGRGVAQEPAERSLRGAVAESTKAVGTSTPAVAGRIAAEPLLQGGKTIVDEPLQLLQQQEKAAYQAVDKTAGFDLKAEKLQLANDQYNIKQLGNTPKDQAARDALQTAIQDSTQRISDAESKLKAANIDPKAADALHTTRMAGQDFRNVMIRSTAPDGTINIDKMLNNSKMLRFSKRGDRLAQFMGQQAADEYMQGLQAAQKAGVQAMKVQKFAKWVSGLLATGLGIGAGVEAAGHAKALLAPEP